MDINFTHIRRDGEECEAVAEVTVRIIRGRIDEITDEPDTCPECGEPLSDDVQRMLRDRAADAAMDRLDYERGR
jgi:hypothetical protein